MYLWSEFLPIVLYCVHCFMQGRSRNPYVIISSNAQTKEQTTNESKEVPLLELSMQSSRSGTTSNTDGVQHEPPPPPFKPEGITHKYCILVQKFTG